MGVTGFCRFQWARLGSSRERGPNLEHKLDRLFQNWVMEYPIALLAATIARLSNGAALMDK